MKILVTGSNGFVGKNLISELKNRGYNELLEFNRETNVNLLNKYTKECDFVYHLAGVNRPNNPADYLRGNFELTSKLLELLQNNKNKPPILITSSIQAEKNNPYGLSKKLAEDSVFKYGKVNNTPVYVYRLTNLFGKWSKPNYNTVVATYCHNVARNLKIQVNEPEKKIELCYIDDLLEEFLMALENNPTRAGRFCTVYKTYKIKLRELAKKIISFRNNRKDLYIPDVKDELTKKLYSTYLSFLPEKDFSYKLKMNMDHRGSFTEFFKTINGGQVSVNISKPGINKGNHWHHTKIEKFLVVCGQAIIKFKKIGTSKTFEYKVTDKVLKVVDIPAGYAHSIMNVGKGNLVTIIWANEPFDISKSDTYFEEI